MLVSFETIINSRGMIALPEKYRNLANHRVSVTVMENPIDGQETNPQKSKIMKYAGIFSDLSDEDFAEIQKRQQNFFGDRSLYYRSRRSHYHW